MGMWHVAGAAGAELRDQERTDKPPSRVRGARPHPTADVSLSPRSRSIAAARATSRQRGGWILVGYLAGAAGAEPRNQERTDKPRPACAARGPIPREAPPCRRARAPPPLCMRHPAPSPRPHTTGPPTCVRACGRACAGAQHAAAAGGPPRATEFATRPASSEQAHRAIQRGGRGGREARNTSTTTPPACARACAAHSRRKPASSDRARHLGAGPPRLSSSVGNDLGGVR